MRACFLLVAAFVCGATANVLPGAWTQTVWQDAEQVVSNIANAVLADVPGLNAVVQLLLDFFFPAASSQQTWDALFQQIQAMVDKEFLQNAQERCFAFGVALADATY